MSETPKLDWILNWYEDHRCSTARMDRADQEGLLLARIELDAIRQRASDLEMMLRIFLV